MILGLCILESAYIIYVRRRRDARKLNINETKAYQNIFLRKMLVNLRKAFK